MSTVSDLMTEAVLMLSPESSLTQAAETLATLGVSGAPVCAPDGVVVGVFSKSDVVDRLRGGRLDDAGTVGKHMTRKILAIGPDEPIERAIDLIAREGVHRLIVVESGRVVGILTPLDIVKGLSSGKLRR